MKKALLILFLLIHPIIAKSQTGSEFTWLNPTPQGNNLNWVKRWDSQTIYAVGDNATFMKTTNAGASWYYKSGIYESSNVTSERPLNDAFFLNKNTGWVCGYQKVLKTTDAGISWDTVLSQDDIWNEIYFINSNTGFVAGTFSGRISKTTDGGNTWSSMGSVPSGRYYSFYAFDTTRIIAVCNLGRIRKTTNGGLNWSTINITPSTEYNCIKFVNQNTGYLCGNSGNIKYTTDFGDTWTAMGNGINTFATLSDIDFFSSPLLEGGPSNVYITGNDSGIYTAPIGVDNFTLVPVGYSTGRDLISTSINFTGDTIISAGEFGRIDGRESGFVKAYTKTVKTSPLNDIWADSMGNHIIAVGYMDWSSIGDGANIHNQILYSTNGGTNWSTADYPDTVEQGILSISMINSSTGYVTGTSGIVSKTTNGGMNWFYTAPSPISVEMKNIEFVNTSTGFAFGSNGKGIKTTNGGSSWDTISTNMGNSYIFGASFINANTGWIVGSLGKIRKTTNGGVSFEIQNTGLSGTLYDIEMQNSNSGYVASFDGNLKRTTDGGTTWFQVNTPFGLSNFSMSFINEMTGIVTSSGNYIFKTSTGGDTWEAISTLAPQISGVHMVAPNTAYLCGTGGSILRYGDVLTGSELTFSNNVPEDLYLGQNYPNPFNPSTSIKFGLHKKGLVSLSVFDITGREVANLINNQGMNAGQVTQRFDGSRLASGVYFYTLTVDGKLINTKKMVLIK